MGDKLSVTHIFVRLGVLNILLLWQLASGATFNDGPKGVPYGGRGSIDEGPGYSANVSQIEPCGYQGQRLNCTEASIIPDIINNLQSPTTYTTSFVKTTSFVPTISCSDNEDAQIKCFCDNTGDCFINEIRMSGYYLAGFIPYAISTFQHLKVLDLSSNQLQGFIPSSLGSLNQLISLDLSYNKLIGNIPNNLTLLSNLKNLSLANNNLVDIIPQNMTGLKSLQLLDLSSNQLIGPIPKSLGNCTNLTTISLRFNFLNESIPGELGALRSLEYLNLFCNSLSGSIPAALGNLTNLVGLNLGENNLDGELPKELGNLTNIQYLRLFSNRFTGNIPAEYYKLMNLSILYIGGNNLSGAIPEYIGNWTNLTALNLLGNNFEGNLPAGIFNLSNLQTLWVSDISKPGISFPKQANLTSIQSLVLRNCLINDSIPEYVRNWTELKYLDLSFNNLTNGIPESFQHLDNLILTRNNLSALPSWIINQTRFQHQHPEADLTYNSFSGPCSNEECFGQWADVKILPNRGFIPSMMKTKKCRPKFDTLFINCGGEEVNIGKHRYHNDTATSSFYLNSEDNWAYSFSGYYIGTDDKTSVGNVTCDVSVPEANLYTDFRVAPVSLTYYGFCLHKGKYTVTLHFAELLYSKQDDYSINGKRVFDVYSQGLLKLMDFNIKEKARKPNNECTESFSAAVGKDGVLEIKFYWAGKGSMYNPPYLNGPLISAISITRDVSKKLSALAIAGITIGCALFLLLLFVFMWWMGWIGDREFRKKEIKLGGRAFSPKEIIDATQKFNPNMKLGEGRLGTVYKAELAPDLTIAVKKLHTPSTPKEKEEFAKAMNELANEVYAMKNLDLNNENLVQLLAGYSKKGLNLLIYEYMELKSLGKALFDQNSPLQLNWPSRYNICKGIAKGLKHLHERPHQIIHRNIKANNILLDANYNAKISDFGLAKLYEEENPYSFIEASKDTASYMAPEYATRKAVTVKIDVYSFGVLLLEIVSGRNNAEYRENQEFVFLVDTACNLHARGRMRDLVDKRSPPYDRWNQANTILNLAIMCIDLSPSLRPTMSQVVSVLEGEKPLEEITKEITHSTT